MAFQRVPNTAEINVIYTYHGEIVQNVYYAEFPSGYVLGNLASLAGHIDLQVGVVWVADQPAEAIYLRTEVRGLNAENDFFATANANAGPGTSLSPALPGNVTFAVKKTSGLTGRSARGRTFWIGIPTDELDPANENLLLQTFVDQVVGNVDLIRIQTPVVSGWLAVLVSRFTGGVKRSEGETFPWVGSVAVDNVVDTHRNRLP